MPSAESADNILGHSKAYSTPHFIVYSTGVEFF